MRYDSDKGKFGYWITEACCRLCKISGHSPLLVTTVSLSMVSLTCWPCCMCMSIHICRQRTKERKHTLWNWERSDIMSDVRRYVRLYNTARCIPWFPLDSIAVYNDYIHGFFFYIWALPINVMSTVSLKSLNGQHALVLFASMI